MITLVALAMFAGAAGSLKAHPINLDITATWGLYNNTEDFSDLLPAGYSYQIWWSADAAYGNGGVIDESTAGLTTGGQANGDYVLWHGDTDTDGGWFIQADNTGNRTDANVGNNVISDGYVYGYLYDSAAPVGGTPFMMTQIYGPTTTGAWGNPLAAQPPPPDVIDFAPQQGSIMGDSVNFVVPEPGTMALFGLGMLTIAARRRRQA